MTTMTARAVVRRVEELSPRLSAAQAVQIMRTEAPRCEEELLDAWVRDSERRRFCYPRRHLSLEQTAVMVWLRHGRLYTRQGINSIEKSALKKIRSAAQMEAS